jgi:competence protein ComEA
MPPERRAVLLLLGLALAGQWLRSRALEPDAAPGEATLLGGGPTGSPRAHRDSSITQNRPLSPGEGIDLDRAGVAEIARLPRVGLTLARTIVADRSAHGPFGGLEGLDRVPGIGPGLLAAIAPHARFSAVVAAGSPQTAPSRAEPAPVRGQPQVDLNAASAEELERLPFVGPYMARQIVAFRERHGPFAAVDSLVRVPGIGPATLAKVRERLRTE